MFSIFMVSLMLALRFTFSYSLNLELKNKVNYSEIIIDNYLTYYVSNIKLGTPAQDITVIVDTGSSDLWVVSSDVDCINVESRKKKRFLQDAGFSRYLNKIDDESDNTAYSNETTSSEVFCSVFGGMFNSSDSVTFHSNDTYFYDYYSDGTTASGTWGYDVVQINDIVAYNLSFGLANNTNQDGNAILGLGLMELEATDANISQTDFEDYTYFNLPQKLVELGVISRNVYSLFLNNQYSYSGSILFGAVDYTKFIGDLTTHPLTSTEEFMIALSGISFNGENLGTENAVYDALFDCGNTAITIPASIAKPILEYTNSTYNNDSGLYAQTCSYLSELNIPDLIFDFQGATIRVPQNELIIDPQNPYGNGQQEAFYDSEGRALCFIAIQIQEEDEDDLIIVGDYFLRSCYTIFDLDNKELSIAQANWNYSSLSSSITEITGSTIPGATPIAEYTAEKSSTKSPSSISTTISGLMGEAAVAAAASIDNTTTSLVNSTSFSFTVAVSGSPIYSSTQSIQDFNSGTSLPLTKSIQKNIFFATFVILLSLLTLLIV